MNFLREELVLEELVRRPFVTVIQTRSRGKKLECQLARCVGLQVLAVSNLRNKVRRAHLAKLKIQTRSGGGGDVVFTEGRDVRMARAAVEPSSRGLCDGDWSGLGRDLGLAEEERTAMANRLVLVGLWVAGCRDQRPTTVCTIPYRVLRVGET